jgi:hypothetical protein
MYIFDTLQIQKMKVLEIKETVSKPAVIGGRTFLNRSSCENSFGRKHQTLGKFNN